jgi:addiction module HigA family antidote
MAVPPGNSLEALKGDRAGQHSIRVNDQSRICFRWREGNAHNVEIVDYHRTMKSKALSNITQGEILEQEFLKPMKITQYRLAKDIGVPPRRINEIIHGERAITADTALRLGRYFGMSPQFWLNLQSHYDLEQEQERLAGRLEKEVKVLAAA